MLNDSEADNLLQEVTKTLNLHLEEYTGEKSQYRSDIFETRTVFNIANESHALKVSSRNSIYRLGSLIFVPMYELSGKIEGHSYPTLINNPKRTRKLLEQYKLCLSQKMSDYYQQNAGNIFFISPISEIPYAPVNDHTALMIASMLTRRDEIKGSVVIDAGSGNGLLSDIALRLGAKKAVLVDISTKALIWSSIFLEAHGWQKNNGNGGNFEILNIDFTHKGIARDKIARMLSPDENAVGLANIGPWKHYGNANVAALEFLVDIPEIRTVVNGGYRLNFPSLHQQEFIDAAAFFEKSGFQVEQVSYRDNGALIANRSNKVSSPLEAATAAGSETSQEQQEIEEINRDFSRFSNYLKRKDFSLYVYNKARLSGFLKVRGINAFMEVIKYNYDKYPEEIMQRFISGLMNAVLAKRYRDLEGQWHGLTKEILEPYLDFITDIALKPAKRALAHIIDVALTHSPSGKVIMYQNKRLGAVYPIMEKDMQELLREKGFGVFEVDLDNIENKTNDEAVKYVNTIMQKPEFPKSRIILVRFKIPSTITYAGLEPQKQKLNNLNILSNLTGAPIVMVDGSARNQISAAQQVVRESVQGQKMNMFNADISYPYGYFDFDAPDNIDMLLPAVSSVDKNGELYDEFARRMVSRLAKDGDFWKQIEAQSASSPVMTDSKVAASISNLPLDKEEIKAAIDKMNGYYHAGWLSDSVKNTIVEIMPGLIKQFQGSLALGEIKIIKSNSFFGAHSVRSSSGGSYPEAQEAAGKIVVNKKNGGTGFNWEKLRALDEYGKGIWMIQNRRDRDLIIGFEGSVLTGSFGSSIVKIIRSIPEREMKQIQGFISDAKYDPRYNKVNSFLADLLLFIFKIDAVEEDEKDMYGNPVIIVKNPFAFTSIQLTLEQKAESAFRNYAVFCRQALKDIRQKVETGEYDKIDMLSFGWRDVLEREFYGPELSGLKEIIADAIHSYIGAIRFSLDMRNKSSYKNFILDELTKIEKCLQEFEKLAAAGRLLEAEKARVKSGLLDASRVLASSPVKQESAVGGIDFRSLPIVTQAVSNLRMNCAAGDTFRKSYQERFQRKVSPDLNLNKEWQEIERMSSSGITPSSERIKEYLQASCVKGSILQDKDKIILCIADILRSEEEGCCATDPTLRDILIVLEASGSNAELSRIFLG